MAELLISVSLLGPSKQSLALVMLPFEFEVTSEKHKYSFKAAVLEAKEKL